MKTKTSKIKVNRSFSNTEKSIEELTRQNTVLQTRLDEQEDRSRRNNLIFYGIPDFKEPWKETESKVNTLLADADVPSPLMPFNGPTIWARTFPTSVAPP